MAIKHHATCNKSLMPRAFEHLSIPLSGVPYITTVFYCAECGGVEEIPHAFKNMPQPLRSPLQVMGLKQPTNWIKWVAWGGSIAALVGVGVAAWLT